MVFVFSGTSEGREVCEKLSHAMVKSLAFVATEYGNAVMKEDENIRVSVGRLNAADIADLIKRDAPDYVIDATHPHATEITENIKAACIQTGYEKKYIRVGRSIKALDDDETVLNVSSAEEAAKVIKNYTDGNILLTTGVKELKTFCENSSVRERLIVRIIPGRESLDEVLRLEIPVGHIVAMEGPFSLNMNKALIEQYNIKVLVTKNSGQRGGFEEKIDACRALGVKAVVIDRTDAITDASAISVDETVGLVSGNGEKKIVSLVSASVCSRKYLTQAAYDVIESAEMIIGAARMAEFGRSINSRARIVCEYKPDAVAEIIRTSNVSRICVLFSGDTGLCSGAKGVREAIEKAVPTAEAELIPGVSSLSYLASRIGYQYSDYAFVNMHGRDCDFMNYMDSGFFAICSGVNDVKKVSEHAVGKMKMFAGKNLGSEDEQIIQINSTEDAECLTEGLYVIAVVK